MNYGFVKCDIKNLTEVDDTNVKTYYNYNGVDFYYRKNNDDDRLLVNFHGSINIKHNIPLPVFRCHNWKYNVLCIADKLLQTHKTLLLGWYCTENTTNDDTSYKDIIKYFISNHNNVIFYGSSGGGMPSLLYAAYFHKKAYITNAQLYLDKYSFYPDLMATIDVNNLTEPIHADKIIAKHGLPSMMYIYVNEHDIHHYMKHFIPFMKYINDNKLNTNFKFIAFKGAEPPAEKSHHHVNLPINIKVEQIINELFDVSL
jgi:hypothetical protein